MGHNVVVLLQSQLPAFGVVQSGSQALLLAPLSFCLKIWIPVKNIDHTEWLLASRDMYERERGGQRYAEMKRECVRERARWSRQLLCAFKTLPAYLKLPHTPCFRNKLIFPRKSFVPYVQLRSTKKMFPSDPA